MATVALYSAIAKMNMFLQDFTDTQIEEENSRERRLVLAMIVARIIDPCSKLATARGLHDETSFSSLGEMLGLDGCGF